MPLTSSLQHDTCVQTIKSAVVICIRQNHRCNTKKYIAVRTKVAHRIHFGIFIVYSLTNRTYLYCNIILTKNLPFKPNSKSVRSKMKLYSRKTSSKKASRHCDEISQKALQNSTNLVIPDSIDYWLSRNTQIIPDKVLHFSCI